MLQGEVLLLPLMILRIIHYLLYLLQLQKQYRLVLSKPLKERIEHGKVSVHRKDSNQVNAAEASQNNHQSEHKAEEICK